MKKKRWDIFFDLHGVLVDPAMVRKNYYSYIEKVLLKYGYSAPEIDDIHEQIFSNWLSEIMNLIESFDLEQIDSRSFMVQYSQIDKKWEEEILAKIPRFDRKRYFQYFNTSNVEFDALADGKYAMLYPDTLKNLENLQETQNVRLHVASSASSVHVKGILTKHNLMDFFVGKIGYDTVCAPKKSHKLDYFHKMLKIVNANPKTSIYVGDSIEEYVLTDKVGLKYIWIARKDTIPFPLDQLQPSPILNSLDGLGEIIKEMIYHS